jgi:hypothetical protein
MTAFLLLKNYDHYAIRNDDADYIAGRAYPRGAEQGPYEVISAIGPSYQRNDIGVVKSLSEVIPTFIDHYKKNPVPWERETPALYWRYTMFVILRVEQDQHGKWLAYRDEYPMLQDAKTARFATCAEAQRAADKHELDLFPNAKVIEDGFSWLPNPEIDWRSVPHLAEERANWLRSSSHLIVWRSDDHATTSSSI